MTFGYAWREAFGEHMNQLVKTEYPYERFEQVGAKALTDAELIAIILRTGTVGEDALALAHRVLALTSGKTTGILALNSISLEELLKIKAVFLRPNEPFTWASGIKSPIYCDNRLTLSYVDVRKVVEEGLAEIIRTYYPTCEVRFFASRFYMKKTRAFKLGLDNFTSSVTIYGRILLNRE